MISEAKHRLERGLRKIAVAALALGIAAWAAPAREASAQLLGVRAGAGKMESTWHVGAPAGQYASDGASIGTDYFDPNNMSMRRVPSYGLQGGNTTRALIIEGTDGQRVCIVVNDHYIPQDLVNQRLFGLLAEHDLQVSLGLLPGELATGCTDDNAFVSVTHSHSSVYISSISWGVWAFQDVFDIRYFEYIAEQMSKAVIAAAQNMRPTRMGAAVSPFAKIHRHSFGPAVADDGSPAGYPQTDNDKTVSVVRFDDMTNPLSPAPLATWVVYGGHPEMLEGNDLLASEYVNTMYRMVDREVGGMTLFSQNNTGTAEPGDDARAQDPAERAEYSHKDYAQAERAARILADAVKQTRLDIANDTPQIPGQFAPFSTNFPVKIAMLRFAPPSLRVSATVSNCRAEQDFDGNPGVPVAGLPDCEYFVPSELRDAIPFDPGVTYDAIRQAGIPIADNVSAPSYTGLQETLAVKLQAVRLGNIGITVCPCEQWGDQSRNIKSRLNKIPEDLWLGFDWAAIPGWCQQNGDTSWTCKRPSNRITDSTPNLAPISDETYRRFRAQINNNAAGWEDLSYAPYAESEPVDPLQIRGNYTHEELHAQMTNGGYDVILPVGMSNDYLGYIATYREYQRGDHYRKALTGLGPHSSDFLVTRLTRMAASLDGGPAVTLGPKDMAPPYSTDHAHQVARAAALGAGADVYLPLYEATRPADGGATTCAPINGGTNCIVTQPSNIQRFNAARVRWIGGSNFFDLPKVKVQRLEGTVWKDYGDGSGEVQYRVYYPQPASPDIPLYEAGLFEWNWEATFEAFDSDIVLPDMQGVPRTQTPVGTYRFVIDGTKHTGAGMKSPYHLESANFTVSPWQGITIPSIQLEPDNTVSFTVGPTHTFPNVPAPIDYPDSYTSPFPFIRNVRTLKTYGPGPADDQSFCFTCTFRPWAEAGSVATATLTIKRFLGPTVTSPTTLVGGRYRSTLSLGLGDMAYVAVGGVVDTFGEYNGAQSAVVVR